jgi:O-antigen/teichoic acid export membrane protein
MNLAFIPLYIKLLGAESYGLIGLFVVLQTTFSIFDMGISATFNREMARLNILAGSEQLMRNLARTLEIIYWCIAFGIALSIIAISPVIAHHWVQAKYLSPNAIEEVFYVIGVAIAIQWPAGFYSGGLMGLQRQVQANIINTSMATLRGVGAVLVLWLISPTIQAFFIWQIITAVLHSLVSRFFFWRSLQKSETRPVFEKEVLKGIWRFASGMGGLSILSTIFSQMDKVILSSMLTLDVFGYYAMASIISLSLLRIIYPVSDALYPQFVQLVSVKNNDGLKQLFHKGCQLLTVLLLPVACVICLFSYEILLLWTKDVKISQQTSAILSFLTLGVALEALAHIPNQVQFAHGVTRFLFLVKLTALIVQLPLMYFLISRYSALGGAIVQLILYCVIVPVTIHFVGRRMLPEEKSRWYLQDVGIPLLACCSTASLGRLLMNTQMTQLMTLIYIGTILALTITMTIISAPLIRTSLFIELKILIRSISSKRS